MRSLTYYSDALNAFRGILNCCRNYSYQGIPLITGMDRPVVILAHLKEPSSTELFLFGIEWSVCEAPLPARKKDHMHIWSWVSLATSPSRTSFSTLPDAHEECGDDEYISAADRLLI